MKIVIDIECNSLVNPSHIWLIVCRDIDTNVNHVFRRVTEDEEEKQKFLAFARGVKLWIGHNILGYDYPILYNLLGLRITNPWQACRDTLILSKLFDYSREGHSIEQYGREFGVEKIDFSDWTKYSQEMEDYCVRDVEIGMRVWHSMARRAMSESWRSAIELEQQFQLVVNSLHNNGFAFDRPAAQHLLEVVVQELKVLDDEILKAFPPRSELVREITPKLTKHGTLNRTDFRWVNDGDLSDYTGDPFSRLRWIAFNPSSHKQIIRVLNEAGWKPIDKTATHIYTERELNKLKFSKGENTYSVIDLKKKLKELQVSGWKINETNLNTLPKTAPSPARTLAKRILLESRRRTLTEWLGLVQADGRIHGKFYGIGAWTHRMAHQQPNTANIPTLEKLYGKEMRSLWRASLNKTLVGVDAEGIQLRIFAHYIDDKEFTDALVRGKKSDKTDPHSLNQRILGRICKSRQDAKRFIYAYLLGAGLQKLADILGASVSDTQEALDRLLQRYTGLQTLKEKDIPRDAKRGYFIGLDGRQVPIPGNTPGERKHLVMSGYLQNGEAIIMKRSAIEVDQDLLPNEFLVNDVHDELIYEVSKDRAKYIGNRAADAIRISGEFYKLKCPLAGEYKIGATWASTH
jgi:DNA polymerase I-like protein with 3'-5' exonuclease and polymerase domains